MVSFRCMHWRTKLLRTDSKFFGGNTCRFDAGPGHPKRRDSSPFAAQIVQDASAADSRKPHA